MDIKLDIHCSTELVHNVKELHVCTQHDTKMCMFIENAPNMHTVHVCTTEMCTHRTGMQNMHTWMQSKDVNPHVHKTDGTHLYAQKHM
jgi:NADH:ubiquinone oxidoreductase subunit E